MFDFDDIAEKAIAVATWVFVAGFAAVIVHSALMAI